MTKVIFSNDNHSYQSIPLHIVLPQNKTMLINIGSDERVIRVFAEMVISSMCIFYNSNRALIDIPIMMSAEAGIRPFDGLPGIKTTGNKSSEV